jgi:insertion element IS1 protein InsB
MTGSGRRLLRTYSVNALWRRWASYEPAVTFDVVIWMTDGWPLYESRLKGKLHVISKRYTQRIERHNLNLRQHLARLGRKSLSFSKSVELHDKVIGHYLNIKHYQ